MARLGKHLVEVRSGRRNFLEWLVEMLLVLTLLPALLSPAVHLVLLKPAAYRQAIAVHKLDERLAALLAEWFTHSGNGSEENNLRAGLSHLSQEQLAAELSAILPAGWVEEQADQLVDRLLDTLNLRTDTLKLPVDLRPLKTAMEGNQMHLADVIVASWPACTAQDLLDLGVLALSGDITGVPYCQPPQVFAPLVTGFVQGLIRLGVGSLPDQLDLALLLPGQVYQPWIGVYRIFRIGLNTAPLAALFIALLAFAFFWPDPIPVVRLFGRSLITASAVLALLLLGGYALAAWLLPRYTPGWLSLLPASITSLSRDILRLVGQRYMIAQLVWLLLAGLIGFGLLWVLSRLMVARRD